MKATRFFSIQANWNMSFKHFKAYRDPRVVESLKMVFRGKCAYCESRIVHIESGDVEHFRPKGGYVDSNGKKVSPGYYWLAADWTNLLLSCSECNRPRRKTDGNGVRAELADGKWDHFPLVDESSRARRPGWELREYPVLLDPCAEDVEDYFDFTPEGDIIPAYDSGIKMERATGTIRIIGLQRYDLARRRHDQIVRISDAIYWYRRSAYNALQYPKDLLLVEDLKRARGELLRWCSDDEDYSAMARRIIQRECPEVLE